jgi:hypothetical protein
MVFVAIYRCAEILEYVVAFFCPCLYLIFIIGKKVRGNCKKKKENDINFIYNDNEKYIIN